MTDKIEHDPAYEWVHPTKANTPKRGRQCGECGAKFDFGTGYGFYCTVINCPMGMGGSGTGGQFVTGGAACNT